MGQASWAPSQPCYDKDSSWALYLHLVCSQEGNLTGISPHTSDTSNRTGVLYSKSTIAFGCSVLTRIEKPGHGFPYNLPLSHLLKPVLCSINLTWADISNTALLDHI